MRWADSLLHEIDVWRESQESQLSRPEAIRILVAEALGAGKKKAR
jgi:hypothetical protein